MTKEDYDEIVCVALLAMYRRRGYTKAMFDLHRSPKNQMMERKAERCKTMMIQWQKRLDELLFKFAKEMVLPQGRFDDFETEQFGKIKHSIVELQNKYQNERTDNNSAKS